MKLLVSVRDSAEAIAALGGGADIIDIKEPDAGSLGKADDQTITDIVEKIDGQRPVSAALGELVDQPALPTVASKLAWLKTGLSNTQDTNWIENLAMFCAPIQHQAVAVAYADYQRAKSPTPSDILQWAIDFGSPVFLIDTFIKDGKTLLDHMEIKQIAMLIHRAKTHNVAIALAGSLHGDALIKTIIASPDIIAVRGAVCENQNRTSGIDVELVKQIKKMMPPPEVSESPGSEAPRAL